MRLVARAGRGLGSGAKPGRFGAHATVLRCAVVVPTEQMKEPVGKEHRDFVENVGPTGFGLPPGRWNAHNHIAEQPSCQSPELAFAHGKRKYVGWAIFFAIEFVQLMHSFVGR